MMFFDVALGMVIGAAGAALAGFALSSYHEYQREISEEIGRLHRRISDVQDLARQIKTEGKIHDKDM